MIELAVQIINFNTKSYLKNCMDDVLKDLEGSGIGYSINILDNGSDDDLSDLKKEYKNVDFFESETNLGFGGGHNFLSTKTNSRYILVLNPDIRLIERPTIPRLFRRMNHEESIKIIGPKLLDKSLKDQEWDHGELDTEKRAIIWRKSNQQKEVVWVAGTVFMVERETFESVGGFDKRYFLYKEEEDLCLQIINQGGKILYYPEVKVMHYGSVVANKSNKYFEESIEYFNQKNEKLVQKLFNIPK